MFFFCFFFKQKTAYEMRISDWSSDVCSSDLDDQEPELLARAGLEQHEAGAGENDPEPAPEERQQRREWHRRLPMRSPRRKAEQIGRASCRERVCQYV